MIEWSYENDISVSSYDHEVWVSDRETWSLLLPFATSILSFSWFSSSLSIFCSMLCRRRRRRWRWCFVVCWMLHLDLSGVFGVHSVLAARLTNDAMQVEKWKSLTSQPFHFHLHFIFFQIVDIGEVATVSGLRNEIWSKKCVRFLLTHHDLNRRSQSLTRRLSISGWTNINIC